MSSVRNYVLSKTNETLMLFTSGHYPPNDEITRKIVGCFFTTVVLTQSPLLIFYQGHQHNVGSKDTMVETEDTKEK